MQSLAILWTLLVIGSKVNAKLGGRQNLQDESPCGCSECKAVWNTLAGQFSCGDRIEWLKSSQGLSEEDACVHVAELEFPYTCGACNPNGCTPMRCGCNDCTERVWENDADGFTCGDRITWVQNSGLSERDACNLVAHSQFPTNCLGCSPETCGQNAPTSPPTAAPTNQPTHAPTNAPTVKTFCNCQTCTEDVWNSDADGYTCGARISWVLEVMGHPEDQACHLVAGEEFPIKCRGCDPNACAREGSGVQEPKPSISVPLTPVEPAPVPRTPPNGNNPKCGGAVNTSGSSNTMCQNALWTPTNDPSMHCFAYGGPGDPCHLSNNNDPNDGLDKDPSKCSGDTLYLWDEPDTQGRSYTWAGRAWNDYANRFANELRLMRQAGTKVTTPLIRAGESEFIKTNVDAFFDSCGASCRDPNSPAYIDIIAVNAFCGPWNGAPLYCRGGADFITAEVQKVTAVYNLPAYITNWSKLRTSSTDDQVDAIEAIDGFFVSGSPIERVYWFGATDYGGGSANNFLTNTIADGRSLGQLWKAKCDALN